MKKLTLLVVLVAVVGCKNFEDLEAGNAIALKNQTNLESNAVRALDNFKKAGKAYAEATGKQWTEDDEKTWNDQRNELILQLAINKAWLLVIEEAIKHDSLNADLLGSIITEIPEWIKEGKDIYDLIKSKK